MPKPIYPTILLSTALLVLMLAFPSARLMAQTEERRSVESSTSSTSSTTEVPPPTEERRSVTTTTSSTKAASAEKPHCANQCRDHYDRSMSECNLPDHPDRKDCEKWAREREKKCLEKCYRQ